MPFFGDFLSLLGMTGAQAYGGALQGQDRGLQMAALLHTLRRDDVQDQLRRQQADLKMAQIREQMDQAARERTQRETIASNYPQAYPQLYGPMAALSTPPTLPRSEEEAVPQMAADLTRGDQATQARLNIAQALSRLGQEPPEVKTAREVERGRALIPVATEEQRALLPGKIEEQRALGTAGIDIDLERLQRMSPLEREQERQRLKDRVDAAIEQATRMIPVEEERLQRMSPLEREQERQRLKDRIDMAIEQATRMTPVEVERRRALIPVATEEQRALLPGKIEEQRALGTAGIDIDLERLQRMSGPEREVERQRLKDRVDMAIEQATRMIPVEAKRRETLIPLAVEEERQLTQLRESLKATYFSAELKRKIQEIETLAPVQRKKAIEDLQATADVETEIEAKRLGMLGPLKVDQDVDRLTRLKQVEVDAKIEEMKRRYPVALAQKLDEFKQLAPLERKAKLELLREELKLRLQYEIAKAAPSKEPSATAQLQTAQKQIERLKKAVDLLEGRRIGGGIPAGVPVIGGMGGTRSIPDPLTGEPITTPEALDRRRRQLQDELRQTQQRVNKLLGLSPPSPEPSPSTPAPAAGPARDVLNLKDPAHLQRYLKLQARGLTDKQIEQQFQVTIQR